MADDVRNRLAVEVLRLRGRILHLDALHQRWVALEAEAREALGEPEPKAEAVTPKRTKAKATRSPEERREAARLYQREKRRRERERMAAAQDAQQAGREPAGEPTSPEPLLEPTPEPEAAMAPSSATGGRAWLDQLYSPPEIVPVPRNADPLKGIAFLPEVPLDDGPRRC